ncbi:MAG TPA: MarR family winged helix-turn-helix transcriptional regulator [Noviherbaspirillum sp.]
MATRSTPPRAGQADEDHEKATIPPHMEALRKLRILIRAAQRHSNWIEKQCGVSGAQLWVMQELHEAPGARVGEVAEKLAIHQTTASNLVDALVKKGMVVKERDPVDQRVVRLALSPDGSALLGRAPKPARGLMPEALHKMNDAALAELNNGLQALLDVIELDDDNYGLQPLPFTM